MAGLYHRSTSVTYGATQQDPSGNSAKPSRDPQRPALLRWAIPGRQVCPGDASAAWNGLCGVAVLCSGQAVPGNEPARKRIGALAWIPPNPECIVGSEGSISGHGRFTSRCRCGGGDGVPDRASGRRWELSHRRVQRLIPLAVVRCATRLCPLSSRLHRHAPTRKHEVRCCCRFHGRRPGGCLGPELHLRLRLQQALQPQEHVLPEVHWRLRGPQCAGCVR